MLESEINSNMAVNEEASEVNVGISGAYLGGQLDVLSQACDVSRGKINPVKIAEIILRDHKIIYSAEDFYRYEDGCYRLLKEDQVRKWIKEMTGLKFKTHICKETINALKAECYVPIEELNNTECLNLKNGMFDLDAFRLYPHSPEIYSTIQLDVNYSPSVTCRKWIRSLKEMFYSAADKINCLQEYFGLCLTKENNYEKALFCIGEGANGKSVVLYVLQHLLGEANYSSVPLERFDKPNYLAELFGILANISIETYAKSSVYDSTFKAVVSGDSIKADSKYKQPIQFRPYCKLIFALNNMPRVDDKTDSFFRRLIIVRFPRVFKEEEQDKLLKHKLVEELDGIFLWCLEGLRRLRGRGHFPKYSEIDRETQEYRRQNNNVLLFVEDICEVHNDLDISKDELYKMYTNWCSDNGCKSLSKVHFGKELQRARPSVEDRRSALSRYWSGIGVRRADAESYDRNDTDDIPF